MLLDKIEKASVDELRSLQLSRLRQTAIRCYENVPYHREKFETAGLSPDDLKDFLDLSRFPFLSKSELKTQYPFGLLAVPREKLIRIHSTSGTTGKPTIAGYTSQDIETWSQIMARCIRTAGGKAGDTVQIAYGYGMFTGGLGCHYGAERLGCTVIPVSGGQTKMQVQLIQDLKPKIFMSTPSYLMTVIEEMQAQGLNPESCSLKIGILGAEPWTEEFRGLIEKKISIDALDIYGLSEVMGPGVASECIEEKNGAIIWEDHFYPEVIDPQTLKVLPDGEEGELVLTSLTKEAFPVFRYRTGDITKLLPPDGRSMRRISRIVGRSDDMLVIRGVNVFPSQVESLICQIPEFSGSYLIYVDRDSHLDSLEIHVEMHSSEFNLKSAENLAEQLKNLIKNFIGISALVKVLPRNSIERVQVGKAKRVIDRRKPV